MQIPRNKKIYYTAIIVGLVVILMIPDAILFNTENTLCIHKRVLGWRCPLCGMTRSIHEFIHVRIYAALSYNLLVVFLPIICMLEFSWIFGFTMNKRLQRFYYIFLIVSIIGFYLYRIPF